MSTGKEIPCPECGCDNFDTTSHDIENEIHTYHGFCEDCGHGYDQRYQILVEEPVITGQKERKSTYTDLLAENKKLKAKLEKVREALKNIRPGYFYEDAVPAITAIQSIIKEKPME